MLRAIDIHAHYVPASLLSQISTQGAPIGVSLHGVASGALPGIAFDYGFKTRPLFAKLAEEPERRIASLDHQGIARQFVATWPDIYGYGLAPAACVAWHQMLNDTLAEWCHAHRERFSLIASVPLIDGSMAAAELERAVALDAVGVMVPGNIEGRNIGDCDLDAFWATAARLRLPVILHPVLVEKAPRVERQGLTQIAQYTFDTTLGIGSLIFAGVLDRFPDLTIVLSHGGGAFPYLSGRFNIMHERMDKTAMRNAAEKPPTDYANQLCYDSIVHSPETLRFLLAFAGEERVLLGTDESFPPADINPLASLDAAGFSDAVKRRIAEDNPRRLFDRMRR